MTFASEQDLDDLDRIERSVDIDADAARVWSLVSVPGWWINDGDVTDNEVHDEGGGVFRVVHGEYGAFRVAREAEEEPGYVRFRWLGGSGAGAAEGPDTTVEFFVTARDGGVTLRVVESGWTTRQADRSRWLGHREENVRGWVEELDAARRHLRDAA
jgi:hypothetical protein